MAADASAAAVGAVSVHGTGTALGTPVNMFGPANRCSICVVKATSCCAVTCATHNMKYQVVTHMLSFQNGIHEDRDQSPMSCCYLVSNDTAVDRIRVQLYG